MAIFFIILLSIVILLGLLLRFSSVKINIEELEIINTKIEKFKVKISLNFLNKIPWIQLNIDQKRLKKLKDNNKLKIINKILKTRLLKDYKNIGKILTKNWKKILGETKKIRLEKLNLDALIGTESADTTALATSAVSISVPIIFGRKAERLSYNIKPLYKDKNYIFLSINCIITIKLVHIINIREIVTKSIKVK